MPEIKKKYMKIDYHTRRELIRLILEEGHTTSNAARKTGIKESTARAILVNYKENQIIFEKKEKRQQRIRQERVTEVNANEHSMHGSV